MTTHYLDEAERLCDRLAVIDAGTVVACDSPASLLASMGDEKLAITELPDPEPAPGRGDRRDAAIGVNFAGRSTHVRE